MQLRLVLIGAALLIAIFADLLALRVGQTDYRGQIPRKYQSHGWLVRRQPSQAAT